ncbi:MAG TPA: V-type ATP synthase subunit A, partial [Steroidobacteraceae bacterium]|nr:V-type ATP synthase subunit A [Steroidobacteraceae bacterium]
GLGVGEPVQGTGTQLAVRLGPGLLGHMFDGLQRPLESLRAAYGPFIRPGEAAPPATTSATTLRFVPAKKAGDEVQAHEVLGHVEEGKFRHAILAPEAPGRLARIVDGAFEVADAVAQFEDGRTVSAVQEWPVRLPRPYRRKIPTVEPLVTGQRCIDFLFPLARGGSAIFPGGFGTGKTLLEQSIAKYAEVDIVVYVGCGERGNEMAEMLDDFSVIEDPWSKRPLMERTVVVVNTSNMPVAAREASIYTAVTMAEYYRDMGYHVLLLADSLSRWAEALREISSALEEMPGEEGYPTYLGSRMAEFFARAGVVETLDGRTGSLTVLLSISPPGGDFTEPVTQSCLRNTGAFFMLDTSLAHRRHFPAINWFQSFSLYEADLVALLNERVAATWGALRSQTRTLLQREESLREVAEIIGTEGLQDADRLLMRTTEAIRRTFLAQNAYTEDAFSTPQQTLEKIRALIESHEATGARIAKGETLKEVLAGG